MSYNAALTQGKRGVSLSEACSCYTYRQIACKETVDGKTT